MIPHVADPRAVPSAGPWWAGRWFVLACLLLVALPLLWPPLPPLIDLPSHLGTYHVALDLATSPTLQRWFEFRWQLIGNLGVELLVVPLGKAVGVELATKLIVIGTVVLTAAGMMWIAHEIHGELPPTAAIALPLVYSYPLHFGFLNYCLSMALLLPAFALWLNLGRRGRIVPRAILFAAIAPVVWVAHAVGWGILAVACATAELQRRRARGEPWGPALARTAGACATLAVPLGVMACLQPHGSTAPGGWFVVPDLVKWIVTLFRDRWIAIDLATAALFFAILAWAAAGRGGLRLRPALAVPALAVFSLFVFGPELVGHSDLVNVRIAPCALALLALAITVDAGSERRRRALALAASAFLVARIAATTASLALYSASWTSHLKALDHIEPGSRIVAFTSVPCRHDVDNWRAPRLYHLPSLALVRKDAFTNTEWQFEGLQLLRVKYADARPFDGDPSQTVSLDCTVKGFRLYDASLASFPRAAFDYLWLQEIPPARWPADAGFEKVWADGDSVLYRIRH